MHYIDYGKFQELEERILETEADPNEENELGEDSEKMRESVVKSSVKKEIPYAEIIHYLNEKTGKNFKQGSIKTKELIHARYGEGFTLEDFYKVINLKSAEWLPDPFWNKFLRPETLFDTKFESYLNQQEGKKSMTAEDFDLDE
jgi:uncharacterized phage protein (TIGR02220 family)